MNGQEPFANLAVRPIRSDDVERLLRLFGRLSPETIYRRFFTMLPTPPPAALRRMARVDHHDREALVALEEDEIVAVARWDRLAPDAAEAEVAVVVEDAWQHRGLGHVLMRLLTEAAVEQGITGLVVTVLSENRPAVRLARSLGRPATVAADGPELRMVFRLAS